MQYKSFRYYYLDKNERCEWRIKCKIIQMTEIIFFAFFQVQIYIGGNEEPTRE